MATVNEVQEFPIVAVPREIPQQQALTAPTPMRLIELAVQQGADVDKLAKLMELQLQWERNEARKAYIAAMQAFKANPPDVNKTKLVSYPNKDGSITKYYHAELDVVNDIVSPALRTHGLMATWRPSDNNGRLTVTCVLTHSGGHTEDIATISGPPDTSGGKNSIQAIGSTNYYLQRYTLLAGLGLVPKNGDDDGKTEGMGDNSITDYCIQMQDAMTIQELQEVFKECWQKSKAINDKDAQGRLVKVYEQRKRDLRVVAQ